MAWEVAPENRGETKGLEEGQGREGAVWPFPPPTPKVALTCAVSQKCEQEKSPDHGGDAPVLSFSTPFSRVSLHSSHYNYYHLLGQGFHANVLPSQEFSATTWPGHSY